MQTAIKRSITASLALCVVFALPRCATAVYGIVVGSNGTIRQTPDSGGNWFPRTSGTSQTLRGVDCAGRYCGAVGDGGTILRSEDAGVSWEAQVSGTVNNLHSITYASRLYGWAVGESGTILATTDGGMTWTNQNSNALTDFTDVKCVDVSSVWISGSGGAIRHTTDGGTNWSFQTSGVSPSTTISGLEFTNATVGWYAANGVAGKTTNAGNDWTVALSVQRIFNDADFATPDRGVVVGSDGAGIGGIIFFTDDSGISWKEFTPTWALNAVSIYKDGTGWSVGNSGSLWRTTNGGESWTSQSGAVGQMLGVTAFDVFRPGDYNDDNNVNDDDYFSWRSSFGSAQNLAADGNSDGRVDAADYVIWRKNRSTNGASASLDAVPEPTAFALFLILLVSGPMFRVLQLVRKPF